jgi:vacuolar protein sorting-associated protein 13A/C
MLIVQRINWATNVEKKAPKVAPASRPSIVTAASVAVLKKKAAAVSKARKLRKSQESVYSKVQAALCLDTISLELLLGDGYSEEDGTTESLSQFSLNNIAFNVDMRSDDSLDAVAHISSFVIYDSRKDSQGYANKVARASERVEQQFSASFSRNAVGDSSVKAKIDGTRFVLALDYLFALRDFAVGGIEYGTKYGPENVGKKKKKKKKQSTASAKEPEPISQSSGQLSIDASIVDFETILLENPQDQSSNAIILAVPDVTLTKRSKTELLINNVNMVLCRMDERETTRLRLMDEFSVQLSLEESGPEVDEQSTNIKITMTPLVLRASYRNLMMIADITSHVSKLRPKKKASLDVTAVQEQLLHTDENTGLATTEDNAKSSQNLSKAVAKKTKERVSYLLSGYHVWQILLTKDWSTIVTTRKQWFLFCIGQ